MRFRRGIDGRKTWKIVDGEELLYVVELGEHQCAAGAATRFAETLAPSKPDNASHSWWNEAFFVF